MKHLKVIELKNPEKVTIGDCQLAQQMGYRAVIAAGKITRFAKEDK